MADGWIRYEDGALRLLVRDNLLVAGWFDAPALHHMRTLYRENLKLRRQYPGIGFLNVIVQGAPRFSQEVREEAARQMAEADDRELCTGHLILVGGLKGAAVRAFLSAVILVGRPKEPNKVFADAGEAARWLAPLLSVPDGPQWGAAEVMEAIDASRARRDQPSPR